MVVATFGRCRYLSLDLFGLKYHRIDSYHFRIEPDVVQLILWHLILVGNCFNAAFRFTRFSVSKSGLKEVIAYVENQREHHKKVSYQDEFLLILKRYEIAFNPNYVFEEEVLG